MREVSAIDYARLKSLSLTWVYVPNADLESYRRDVQMGDG
jgi:hypothetical protein